MHAVRDTTGQRGSTAAEYIGMVAVVAAVVAALLALAPGLGDMIASALRSALCEITGSDCGSGPGDVPPAALLVDPQLTPDERGVLLGHPAAAQDLLETLTPEELQWIAEHDPTLNEAIQAAVSWGEELELTDRYIAAPLDDFLSYRDSAERDGRLDYSTNLCSAPVVGSSGRSFDFRSPCTRHDFGYRNYRRLGVFHQKKEAVDNRFLDDMKAHCRTRSVFVQPDCYKWAYVFHEAVKRFG